MIRSALLTLIVLIIAIGGGAGSVWMAINSSFAFGTVSIGVWTAVPNYGTPAADPYSKARFSRSGDLSLGIGEGITFRATHDSGGAVLRLDCDYQVEGRFPSARFWTLHARNAAGAVIAAEGGRSPALQSNALLRSRGAPAVVTVSPRLSPGNWLATRGNGAFALVLSLYDTAIASSARIGEVELPQIVRTGCGV